MSKCKSDDEIRDLQLELRRGGPQPGDIYRHYKGGLYEVVARCLDEVSLADTVVYRSVEKGFAWARPYSAWAECVTPDGEPSPHNTVPRFSFVRRSDELA